MKKILLAYYNNFYDPGTGCNAYLLEIVKLLKAEGHAIDYFSTEKILNNFESFEELNQKHGLVDNLFLYPTGYYETVARVNESPVNLKMRFWARIKPVLNKIKQLLDKIPKVKPFRVTAKKKMQSLKKIKNADAFISHFGWIDGGTVHYFQKVLDENDYDIIYIHYIQIAELLAHVRIKPAVKLIYSAQDLNFMQYYFHKVGVYVGWMLERELDVLNLFDTILCISYDEKIFLEKMLPAKKFYFLPHPLPRKKLSRTKKDIDILFIGNQNKFNFTGLKWFFGKVLPAVESKVAITVVGKIWNAIDDDPLFKRTLKKYKVARIDFAPDLDVLYAKTKIAIAPMFEGTGMKIKTLDAMSRGIPVVATTAGVDGFPDKNTNGCLVSDNPRIFASNLDKLLQDNFFYEKSVRIATDYFEKHLEANVGREVLKTCFQ